MIEYIKSLFRTLTALELASKELADAERDYLAAQSNADFQASMVAYNTNRIKRLRAYIAAETKTVQ